MLVGLVGAPNKGKSTIFSALTLADAEIADYPFTTIKPNVGVAYLTRDCAHREIGAECKPRTGACVGGVRRIPVSIVDVAGLVPGAHLGKGMGNQFLNDLVNADALIQVVDVSGGTDIEGKSAPDSDPSVDVAMIRDELEEWLSDIIMKHADKLAKRPDGAKAMEELLSGFKVTAEQVAKAADSNSLTLTSINWSKARAKNFARTLLQLNKPMLVAANKLDKGDAARLAELRRRLGSSIVVGCSGAIELALKKAAKNGVIDYVPGSGAFTIGSGATPEQRKALDYMLKYVEANHGTGVQEILNTAYYKLLDNIVVYPVEDENKYTDHFGNVLPDAILLKNGSTAIDLAEKIHTDLARKMLYAVDARSKMRLSKDYKLKDNDIIKIVTAGK